ncbi:triose-phosphate isomerase family protein [Leifsonia aquatica]|uniref:Triosephosphate isomerase n=2 Tax=Leifsonia aquatica TaxID=144185 RepID=U2QXE5_LEIAQ|nr:triose-phosphate isomerase family protein [Leifsonia aquatica]ERK60894.1 triose-phosphate isomerase [Leifsonia aquatica ATCC 14665]MBB2967930.1 triosephosphate isomerase [Leifsonia aquatica]
MSAAAAEHERRLTVGISLKLYLSVAETVDWAASLARIVSGHPAAAVVDVFAAPSFPALPAVREALRGSGVRLGAQNVFWQDSGAFTGEVSAGQLAEVGCSLVEIGHAERRRLFGETDEIVAAKAAAAHRAGLQPLICIGEPEEVSPHIAALEVIAQAEAAFADADGPGGESPWLIAYEPHWAIGREDPAPAAHIATVLDALAEWGRTSGHRQLLLYGGSAGPGLLTRLAERTAAVDGVFLGRFAHDPRAVAAVLDEAGALAGVAVATSPAALRTGK